MKTHFVNFIDSLLKGNHAELMPLLKGGEECLCLPFFGVYLLEKLCQIRVVFDSSAQFQGSSLNKVHLISPDLTNSLLGVLIGFRKEVIEVTADSPTPTQLLMWIYSFLVREDHCAATSSTINKSQSST